MNLSRISNGNRSEPSINNIEDLSKQSMVRYGVVRASSAMVYFNQSKRNTVRNLWNVMLKNKDEVFVDNTANGIEKVRQSKG